MPKNLTESVIEQAALGWLEALLGYDVVSGPQIAPGEPGAERDDYGQDILERRLRQSLQRLNRFVPADAIEEAFRNLPRPDDPQGYRTATGRLCFPGASEHHGGAYGLLRRTGAQQENLSLRKWKM